MFDSINAVILDVLLQVALIAVLKNDVIGTVFFERIVTLYDVRMVELLHDFDLSLQ